jgi:hypothetical protein
MNVVLISPFEIFPARVGGAQRILGMGAALANLGHTVTILNLTPWSLMLNEKPAVRYKCGHLVVMTTGLLRGAPFRELIRADIVQFEHPFLFFLMILLKLLRKKLVWDEDGVEFLLSQDIEQALTLEEPDASVRGG